jgi:hypothetical protein
MLLCELIACLSFKYQSITWLYNMQTEADPQVISLLMERAGYGDIARTVINVAGHRYAQYTLQLCL